MTQKGFAPVLIVLLIAIFALGSGYFIYQKSQISKPTQVACTQEAKICPDGSSVGRTGPNCEFTACPIPQESTSSANTTNWKTYNNKTFLFKYPSNGELVDLKSASVIDIEAGSTPPYFIFRMNIADNINHFSTNQVVEKMADDLRNNKNIPWGQSQADKTLQTMKKYTNEEIQGLRLENFSEGYDTGFGVVVDATEDKIYTFSINNGNGEVGDSEEKLLDQILSTFKFLP